MTKFSLQQKKNSPYYFCVFYNTINGVKKQVWKSTKCRNYDDAMEKAEYIIAKSTGNYTRKEIENMIDAISKAPLEAFITPEKLAEHNAILEKLRLDKIKNIDKDNLNFDYILEDYIPNILRNTKSSSLCGSVKVTINKLRKYLNINSIYDLNKKNVNEFKNKLLSEGFRNNTVILYISCINVILKSLFDNDYLDTLNKYSSNMQVIESNKNYTLFDNEFELILSRAKEIDYQIYLTLLIQGYSGLRISELIFTKWEWFKLEGTSLYLNVQNIIDGNNSYLTKNRKGRMIFISSKFFDIYNSIKKDSGFILDVPDVINYNRNSLNPKLHFKIRMMMTELFNQGLIEHVYTSHDFRRYFATRMYLNGTDLYLISKQLGHSNVVTTERYLKIDHLSRNDNSIKF